MYPKHQHAPRDSFWYTREGEIRAYPAVDCSKGKGKEGRGNAEEEPAHLGTTWYSADCQVTARLVEERAQGKGKVGVMSV